MFLLQLSFLILIGLIGLISNWLLVLAIQRKTYHHQHSYQTINAVRTQPSFSVQLSQVPVLPSVRSSISIFDKFILAFLINDILVCNILIPLRALDLSLGLPCAFLCFTLKLTEKLTMVVELTILNLLLISSVIFYCRNRFLTTRLWFLSFILMSPIILSYVSTALTHLDVDENGRENRVSTCKQTFIYINSSTEYSMSVFSCSATYVILVLDFFILLRMKSAIKVYQREALEGLTDPALTRIDQTPAVEPVRHFFFRFLLKLIFIFFRPFLNLIDVDLYIRQLLLINRSQSNRVQPLHQQLINVFVL